MITVRMLGGAKKSFPAGYATLDCGDTTVSGLLEMLPGCKPSGTPDLDTRNVLVAINGADSSVSGGRSAAIRDGDTVDIIPVIHGGAGTHRFEAAGMQVAALLVAAEDADPDELRRRFGSMHVQSVNAEYILGEDHLRLILEISVEAERRGTMLTDHIETDIMLRLVGTTQIAEAIKRAGAGAGPHAVVLALGDAPDLDALCNSLHGASLPFPERDGETPKCYEGVAVPSGRSLQDMLAERAAVL